MSTTNERRNRRIRERMKIKIFKQFQEKMKGKTNGEVLEELERIRVKWGIEFKEEDEYTDN